MVEMNTCPCKNCLVLSMCRWRQYNISFSHTSYIYLSSMMNECCIFRDFVSINLFDNYEEYIESLKELFGVNLILF
jgi:hypothetical protein